MTEKIDIRAESAPWKRGIEILISQITSDGKMAVAKNIVLETVQEAMIIEPTLTISYQEAQTLMDDLWNAGLRPTEGTGSAGALRATEKHLDDMRKIVFKQMEI